MDCQKYKAMILEELRGFFPDTYSVELTAVQKNNGVFLDAVIITDGVRNASPVFYLGNILEKLKNKELNISEACSEIFDMYEAAYPPEDIDVSFFADFDKVKENLYIRLVNYEKNKDFLSGVPHRRFLDLAVIYCYVFNMEGTGGISSVVVTDAHMSRWGARKEELHEIALGNSQKMFALSIRNMADIIPVQVPGEEHLFPMYVLTNDSGFYGAACMVYPGALVEFSEEHDSDVYILPSSVHEVILVASDLSGDLGRISGIVADINKNIVDSTEVLSDHVYVYERETGEIKMCA